MFRALTMFAAIAVVINGPAGPLLVQTAAWVSMLGRTYSLTGSVQRAVAETFDGEHPCCLCRTAQAMAEQQERQQQQIPGKLPVAGKELLLWIRLDERGSGFWVRQGPWIGTLPYKPGLTGGRGREDVEDPPPEQGVRC